MVSRNHKIYCRSETQKHIYNRLLSHVCSEHFDTNDDENLVFDGLVEVLPFLANANDATNTADNETAGAGL